MSQGNAITQIENASKSCVNLRMIENMNQDRTHICSDKVPTVFDILLGLSITNYCVSAHFCDTHKMTVRSRVPGLLISFGTWPPSPYGHHSPVGHSFGLCHPSIVLDPPSAIATTSSSPYGYSLNFCLRRGPIRHTMPRLFFPIRDDKVMVCIGHMTNAHC